MERQPLVSIIVPTYNSEPYITQTIKSIQDQGLGDIEILVVDDGSSDCTREVVLSMGEPVRLLRQNNSGVCAARNKGLSAARGKYICFLDHDDFWLPHKLKSQLKIFEEFPEAGVVYSSFILWHANTDGCYPLPGTFDPGPVGVDHDFSGWVYHQLLIDCWVLTSTAMFRSDVFEHCGVFDVNLPYGEDWDLWLRISRSYRFVKQVQATTLYRQHEMQGNRALRDIDYRTRLLESAVKKWGYCSSDGRCVSRSNFGKQLSTYHLSFAFGHLKSGNKGKSLKSFVRAWLVYPKNIMALIYVCAAFIGWRPNW